MKRGVIALVIVASWSALPARADTTKPPAVDHYQAGKRLFGQKRYAEALQEFHEALAIEPRLEVLYSMAQAQRLLGDCASAIETYRAFLAGQPGEPLGGYARANIERCEHSKAAGGEGPWYGDVVGDVLVGGGVVAGVTGALVWHAGRSAATDVAGAPDYQTFLQRQAAASSALTEQRIGVAAMIVGGAAVIGGVVHYVHQARAARRESSLVLAPTAGGAVLVARGSF